MKKHKDWAVGGLCGMLLGLFWLRQEMYFVYRAVALVVLHPVEFVVVVCYF
jgi:hypothetical protein